MDRLRQNLDEVHRELQEFENTLQRIQTMPKNTEIEKLQKNYAASQLHVRILQRMLKACNHSRDEIKQKFTRLLEEVRGIQELLF
tara:strand:+ start:340 stop:594 length:255 start_codon:yes stop_codon:yes gene_type:complete